MADIKTRDVRRGEIRMLDRHGSMTHRMKNVAVRAKENTINERRSDDSSSSSFAIDQTMNGSERVAIMAVESAKREYAKKHSAKMIRATAVRGRTSEVDNYSRTSLTLDDLYRRSTLFRDLEHARNVECSRLTQTAGKKIRVYRCTVCIQKKRHNVWGERAR